MEACIGEARALGYAAIVLTVTAHNAEAVQFYQSLGFTIFGTERDKLRLADGRSIDDHMMQLDLA